MSHSPRYFHLKPQLRRYFSSLFSISDHPNGGNIDDDWEFIEVFDREFAGAGEGVSAGDDNDSVSGDSVCSDHFRMQNSFKVRWKILSSAELRQRLEDKITRVSPVLLLSRAEAAILLCYFKWSVNKAQDEWLACEEKVRKAIGLYERPVVETPDADQIACGSCHESFPGDVMFAVSCGHRFCRSCWIGYISKAINEGPGCLTLRCPEPSCDAAVGPYMIEMLSSDEDKKKFEHHLLRSYIDCSRKAKWCPSPGCELAVFRPAGEDANNVTCRCLHTFCWNCTNEVHAPIDCVTVSNWMSEMNVQSENWLLANTKSCPSCQMQFHGERVGYCQCTACNHEFCGFCGGDWSEHQNNAWSMEFDWGYCPADASSKLRGNELEREAAKNSLERFRGYYEGWATSEWSKANAITDLKLLQEVRIMVLCTIFDVPETEFEFLVDAQLQIIDCWRFLKWTHVYGYFLPEDEITKRHLLEFMQERAKAFLEILQKQMEEQPDISLKQFMESRVKLIQLTRVTRKYYHGMMEALMAGLPEVVSIPRWTPCPKKKKTLQQEPIRSTDISPMSTKATVDEHESLLGDEEGAPVDECFDGSY